MKPSKILDLVQQTLKDRVILREAEMVSVILWIAHTYVYNEFKLSPLLFVTSGDPGCGKSTLLHTVVKMCENGTVTGRTTEASLARAKPPHGRLTVALDQMDNSLMKDNGAMIDTLCASRERDKKSMLSEINIETSNWEVTYRDLFYPIAVGKIGDLPDRALNDRCLHVRLHPATEEESNWLFRNDPGPVDPSIVSKLKEWFEREKHLLSRIPALPPGLYNRARDKWTPLLSVADLAGGDWPEKARRAAVDMDVEKEQEEETRQVVLLRALVDIIGSHWKHDNIFVHLVREELESRGHTPTSKYWPSNLLSKVGVKSVPIYIPGMKLSRGYKINQIREAAERYLKKEEE